MDSFMRQSGGNFTYHQEEDMAAKSHMLQLHFRMYFSKPPVYFGYLLNSLLQAFS